MIHRPPRLSLIVKLVLLSAGAVALPVAAQMDGLNSNGGLPSDPLREQRPVAEPPDIGADSGERMRTAQNLSRAQAAARARDKHGGRVLSVHWTGDDYRVKLLRHGEVRIVRIADAPLERKDP